MLWATLLLIVFTGCWGEIRYSLNSDELGGTWKLKNKNESINVPGRVPGGVYTDLHDAGVLSEPLFYRFNDKSYRWVSLDDWTYSRTFDVPLEFLSKTIMNLVFDGVDTSGEIFLNGKSLGVVNNMFIRYVYPVKGIIQEKNNSLEVRLESPVNYAAATSAVLPYAVPPACVPDEYQGECHANMVRKMQASFSWDWGPAFPSMGLWKSVAVEGLSIGVIRDITTFTEKIQVENITSWQLSAIFYVDLATEKFEGETVGMIVADRTRIIKPLSVKTTARKNGDYQYIASTEFILDESEVELWWPNGFGNQQLYNLTVSLIIPEIGETVQKSVQFGFRTIELVQEPIKTGFSGLSFYFKVNDVPIFAKGSNWIPGHVLPELGANPKSIRHLLESAKATHMNMLRVWGGGVYESDLFYQIADELGILIWQDMMFACAMYPTTSEFLSSVEIEIEQQIKRLQHHPSIAIWAGNNENEAALRGNWYGTQSKFDIFKADYKKLYVDTIRKVVTANDPSRAYVVSSPSNGIGSENEDFVAINPYSPLFGDVHYYNYISDGWNSATYPDTRFASEYGFQGMPSYTSLKAVSNESDLSLTSEFSQLRQHHPGGNIEMVLMIRKHLPLPEDDGSLQFYKRFIYYSQISQGVSTKTETEKYRRDRSKLTNLNVGNTMGALYWQLNDVWEAPTWASIEFSGRWKLLHYLAKHFFAPVLVSPEITPAGEINVYLVSDLLEDLSNLTLDVSIMDFSSFEPKLIISTNQTAAKATSVLVWNSSSLSNLLTSANCTVKTCFFHFSLSNDTTVLSQNVHFPASFSDVILPAANIKITPPVLLDETTAIFNISAEAIAAFVWLETEIEGVFSDNGFTLLANQKEIIFVSQEGSLNITALEETLTVVDLSSVGTKNIDQPVHFEREVILV